MLRLKNLLFVAAAGLSAASAYAEVSDKMPSPVRAWVIAAVVTVAAFCLCYSIPKAILILLPVLILGAWYIGNGEADILASYKLEVDSGTYYRYRANWIVSSVLMPFGAVLGAILGFSRRRRTAP